MASYIAAAMKILAEDSEDDTDHAHTTNFYSAAISRFPIFWSPYFFQWRNEPKITKNLIKKWVNREIAAG